MPVAGPAVRAAIDDLVALALRLRAPEPVRPARGRPGLLSQSDHDPGR
ncbi:hypothetical protein [Conexibacter woesei]|nr:hypothetical protein [Conexibacter woesei]